MPQGEKFRATIFPGDGIGAYLFFATDDDDLVFDATRLLAWPLANSTVAGFYNAGPEISQAVINVFEVRVFLYLLWARHDFRDDPSNALERPPDSPARGCRFS